MLFKSHLAVLVLGLCELHLIGSVNNDKIALIETNNKDKTAHTTSDQTTQDKTSPNIKPTSITRLTSKDKSQAPTTIHPTSNDKDKTAFTSNDKGNTITSSHPTSNDKDKTAFTSNDKGNTITTTHPTSNDKDKTVSTTQPNTHNAPSTIKLPKSSALKGDTTSHSGGLAATIPSMFTIASLICVLLLYI